jgi:hypothetical protein
MTPLFGMDFHYSSLHTPSASWHIACVAGPQFYGGPDLQRAGFWRAQGRIEGLQESLPFMTTCRSDSER